MDFGAIYFFVFAISALIAALIVDRAEALRLMSPKRLDASAVQCAHTRPTPRVGGIAVASGLLASIFFVPAEMRGAHFLFLSTMLPVFAAGLLEDLGFRIRPRWRLIAGAVSSCLAILLLQDYWLRRADLPVFDQLLSVALIGMVFTIFCAVGISHAFNLIDGLNGLSAGTACVAAIGLAAIAVLSGNVQLTHLSLLLIAALMGFLILNFPGGRIFLGDAGAYMIGHLLAWISIIMVSIDDQIAIWAIMLVFFWPIADTLFAIVRRRAKGVAFDQPDRLHMHQVVLRSLEISLLGRRARQRANPLATLLLMPFIAFPAFLGVVLWDDPALAFAVFFLMVGLFVSTYFGLVRLAQRRFRIVAPWPLAARPSELPEPVPAPPGDMPNLTVELQDLLPSAVRRRG